VTHTRHRPADNHRTATSLINAVEAGHRVMISSEPGQEPLTGKCHVCGRHGSTFWSLHCYAVAGRITKVIGWTPETAGTVHP
jgi:hypothetical protein